MPRPARDEQFRQPAQVEDVVRNYLDMTKPRPRSRMQPTGNDPTATEADRVERWPRVRPIENEGLSLEDGNDFA